MELVTGGDLSQHAKPDKLLPVPDVLQIGFKCCGALDYAAKEGIVHRDIKPANIMIAGGTEVKIADFGAAVLKKSQVVQTAALGSPYYMSPEQIAGQDADFPQRHVLARRGALRAAHRHSARSSPTTSRRCWRRSSTPTPVPPSELRAGLPRALDSVVLRALKKDPGQRYQTWPEFALELSKVGELVLPAGRDPGQREVRDAEEGRDARAARRLGAVGARARRQVEPRSEGQAGGPGRRRGARASSSSPRARPR